MGPQRVCGDIVPRGKLRGSKLQNRCKQHGPGEREYTWPRPLRLAFLSHPQAHPLQERRDMVERHVREAEGWTKSGLKGVGF